MTTPTERTRAVQSARKFLLNLAVHRGGIKRVPKAVRAEAMRILRHYPFTSDLSCSARRIPDLWAEPNE